MIIKGDGKFLPEVSRILMVQLGDIGDLVLTLPAIRALSDHFTNAEISIAVRDKAADLLVDCRHVAHIVSVEKRERGLLDAMRYQFDFFREVRRRGYDLAIDLRTGTRGAILSYLSGAGQRVGFYDPEGPGWRNRLFTHLASPRQMPNQTVSDYYASLVTEYGVALKHPFPVLAVSPEAERSAVDLFNGENLSLERPVTALQPFSLWAYKEWGLDRFAGLARHIIKEFRSPVVIIGGPGDQEKARALLSAADSDQLIDLTGKTRLNILPAVLKRCAMFIGCDSAGMHIAAAVGTPTVSIFGPTDPKDWAPRGEKHHVVRLGMDCQPCHQLGCNGAGRSRCLENLPLNTVFSEVAEHAGRLECYQ